MFGSAKFSSIFVICALVVATPIFVWAHPTCAFLFNREAISRRTVFIKSLQSGNDRRAHNLLEEEKKRVTREIRDLPESEKEELRRHWAGAPSGGIISSPLDMLARASKELRLRPGQIFVDIGSGHGDPSLVIGALNPHVEVTGYDFVKAKVQSANRLAESMALRNVEFIQQDLSDPSFQVRVADYYYFFNPANPEIIRKIVREIKENSKIRPAMIVTLKGGWTDSIIRQEGFVQFRGLNHGRMAVYKLSTKESVAVENRIAFLIQKAQANLQRLKEDLETSQKSPRNYFERVERVHALKSRVERYHKEIIKVLLDATFAERWAYLRTLRKEDLRDQIPYLDALFGIDENTVSSFIRWSLGDLVEENPRLRGIHYPDKILLDQTPWENLFSIVDSMNLKPGDQVVDVGAGVSRLGYLIQLLHPGVKYVGYEVNSTLADETNRIIQRADLKEMTVVKDDVQAVGWQVPAGTTHIVFLNSLANGLHLRVYFEIYRYINSHRSPKPMYIRQ